MTAIPRADGERKAKQDEFGQQYGRDDRVERLGIVPVDRYVFYGGNIQPKLMKMLKYEMIVCANTASP